MPVSRVGSAAAGDQQCCYGHVGDLLSSAEGGGSVSRFSATRQPYRYMLQDFWPKMMCGQLANNASAYRQLRPSDDCSGYVRPEQGVRKYNLMSIVLMNYICRSEQVRKN